MENSLKEGILERLRSQRGRIGFYYKNLITGEAFGYKEDEEYLSASVVKFPMLLQILKWEAEGKVNLTETIRIREEDKMPLSGALTLFTGEPEVDVETLCRLMISVSDNTAANVLMRRFGVEELETGFARMGLEHTHLRRPFFDKAGMSRGLHNVFCPAEMAALLEQLYRGSFVSEEVSGKALEILKQQQFNHKINGFLGESVPAAHKTGEDDHISSDVGIIFAKQPFVVCFAGNEVKVPCCDILMREVSYELFLQANRGVKDK